eukprot:5850827-Ditylum_brightwellii.AAC.1
MTFLANCSNCGMTRMTLKHPSGPCESGHCRRVLVDEATGCTFRHSWGQHYLMISAVLQQTQTKDA